MTFIDLHYNGKQETKQDWSEAGAELYIQGGGSGLVFKKSGGSYQTAFVEVFVDGTFIRGEGATIEEAELSAWNQWQTRAKCAGHEYEARGYKNGAGFCKNCGAFKSEVFTPEELGQYCSTCGTPTKWSWDNKTGIFGCEQHSVKNLDPGMLEGLLRAADELGK